MEQYKVSIFFYNESGVVLSDEVTYKTNNTTYEINHDERDDEKPRSNIFEEPDLDKEDEIQIYEPKYSNYDPETKKVTNQAFLNSKEFIEITHVNLIVTTPSGDLVFNKTIPFNMSNYHDNSMISHNNTNYS